MEADDKTNQGRLRFGRFEVDGDGRNLALDGRALKTSWRGQETLAALVAARGDVVARHALFERLWPGVTVEDSSLTRVVSDLRRTLALGDSERQYIETIPGVGYRLAAPLQAVGEKAPAIPAPPSPRRWYWIAVGAGAAVATLVSLSFVSSQPEPPRVSAEAQAVYDEGKELLNRQSWQPRRESIPLFQRAIELEPTFAEAYAALASALMSDSRNVEAPLIAARKAVELDSACVTCLATLGYALGTREWKWAEAGEYLAKATKMDPSNVKTRRWYAHNLAVMGDLEAALSEAQAVVQMAELESAPLVTKTMILYLLKRYPEAVLTADKAIGIEYDSTGAWEFRSKSLLMLGEHKEALGDLARQWKPWRKHVPEALARLDRDGFEPAFSWFIQASSTSARIGNNPYHRACWFAYLGRHDEALAELEVGVELKPYNMVYTAVDPMLEPLHRDERFQSILAALGRTETVARTASAK